MHIQDTSVAGTVHASPMSPPSNSPSQLSTANTCISLPEAFFDHQVPLCLSRWVLGNESSPPDQQRTGTGASIPQLPALRVDNSEVHVLHCPLISQQAELPLPSSLLQCSGLQSANKLLILESFTLVCLRGNTI